MIVMRFILVRKLKIQFKQVGKKLRFTTDLDKLISGLND
jgi:hypothetical protein